MSEKLGSESFNIVRAQESILSTFSPEQQIEIKKRLNILSSIVYFIGQDFEIGIELNPYRRPHPDSGWHWDFKDNIVRVDPDDLLERPIEYSCFVMGHEAGHRRVTRTHFIPREVWEQPGFRFMLNAIEDPRENNFVADNYPAFRERMRVAYESDLDMEEKSKEKAQERLGKVPRFMQAGFEYIRLWFLERLNEEEFKDLTKRQATQKLAEMIKVDLPDEVKEVVLKTLGNARESWWLYPTKKEADGKDGEQIISDYAEGSYIINLEDIWPEFKKLVDEDIKDEKTRQMMKEMKKQKQEAKSKDKKEGEESDNDEELSQEELEKLLADMSKEERKELEEKAEQIAKKMIDDLSKEISKEIQGKLQENPEEKQESKEDKKDEKEEKEPKKQKAKKPNESKEDQEKREKEIEKTRKKLQEIADKNIGRYEKDRREVSAIINRLTNDLRTVFSERKKTKLKSGFKSGREIDISRRIKEIAKGILPIDSKAWTKKEKPTEKDYAFTLLVDLSGSMQGERIEETFKAVIVLSEVLNTLGIKFNVIGFNDRLYDFVDFGEKLSLEKRRNMEMILNEVSSSRAAWNDDGWAVEEVSKILSNEKEDKKIMIVLSDGEPIPSEVHRGAKFDLKKIVEKIEKEGKHEIIGLGLGDRTKHVENYYTQNIAEIPLPELAKKLAKLLKEIIEN